MKFRPIALFCGIVLVVAAPAWADTVPYAFAGPDGAASEFPGIESSVKPMRSASMKSSAPVQAGSLPEPVSVPPAWIGTSTYPAFAEALPNRETSLEVAGTPGVETIAPNPQQNSGFPMQLTLAALTNGFEANNARGIRGSGPSMVSGTRLLSSPETAVSPETTVTGDIGGGSISLSELNTGENSSSVSDAATQGHNPQDGEFFDGEHRRADRHENSPLFATVPEPGSLSLFLLGLASLGFLGRRRR